MAARPLLLLPLLLSLVGCSGTGTAAATPTASATAEPTASAPAEPDEDDPAPRELEVKGWSDGEPYKPVVAMGTATFKRDGKVHLVLELAEKERTCATKYKAQIQMEDLSARAAKEYDHYDSPNSYAWNDTAEPRFDLRSELGGSMVGKLIGQKLVIYDVKDAAGNVQSVKMELYVDTGSKDLETPDLSKQNWRLLAEYTDDGTNWPDPAAETYINGCNGRKGQMFTWGGPYIALRLDNNVWNLYKMSVRPILPAKLK